ncbi:MAG: YbaN family protein [Gammaproteobacteria bacterium]|nr:YbaN family protein [Gammaproteobacteria bacterium]
MITHLKHSLLILAGCVSLVLGVIGAFMPLLPTVPLVLLAGFCFARSSERLHTWLISNPHFGSIIRNFETGGEIPRRVKIRAISVIWISMIISALIVAKLPLVVMLTVIGSGVTFYLWRRPEPTPHSLETWTPHD